MADRKAFLTPVFWRRRSIGRKPATTPTSSKEAAALWGSFAQNHPFIDGNERTAFDATYTFLVVNGAPLTAQAGEAYAFISELTVASAQRQGGCVDKTRWATGRRPSILVPAPPGQESRRCAHPL